jgi:hypothetical protein
MARPGITCDKVADAADNIISGGDKPTIQSIRATRGLFRYGEKSNDIVKLTDITNNFIA